MIIGASEEGMTCCVGYIGLETKSFVRPGGYNQNYSAHLITPAVTASHLSSACNKDLQGTKVLFSGGQPGGIRLPVPASVRRVEEEKKQFEVEEEEEKKTTEQ